MQARRTTRLGPGDAAIIKGARPYVLADNRASRPSVVIEPGQVCRPLADVTAATPFPSPDGRTWGNAPDPDSADCAFLVGVYELPGQVTGNLLQDLPDLTVVRAGDVNTAAIDLLNSELQRDARGQELVLDRLVDLILIDTLRAWLVIAGDTAPAWWRTQHDTVAGAALTLMHDHPETQWTLATLADACGVSRATFARRFAEQVGEPPLSYLTRWRLARACDLLRTETSTVQHVARQVGYTNAFAFSAAFKRRYGQSPREHRQAVRTA